MQVDNMPAGREMDILIAEKVMEIDTDGYWITTVDANTSNCGTISLEWLKNNPTFDINRIDKDGWEYEGPQYSTDMSPAWEVAEKLKLAVIPRHPGWACAHCRAVVDGGPTWIGVADEHGWTKAETAPLAICRAALKAMGVTEA